MPYPVRNECRCLSMQEECVVSAWNEKTETFQKCCDIKCSVKDNILVDENGKEIKYRGAK